MKQEEFERMSSAERRSFLAERHARFAAKRDGRAYSPGGVVPSSVEKTTSRRTENPERSRVSTWISLAPLAALVLIFIVGLFAAMTSIVRDAQRMTAAGQHLTRATEALARGAIDEGLIEIHAIPASAPEAASAKEIENRLNAARDEARQTAEMRAEQERIAAWRIAQIHGVEVKLRELGYDLRVSAPGNANEVVISSGDFSDTDHRVRFLAYIRSQRGPGRSLCSLGINQVRLSGHRFLASFGSGDAYSLDCWK
jgi:hypothetical protein